MQSELRLLADLELVNRFQAGDATSFRMIYERYHAHIKNYCNKLVHNERTAEDLAQDTFLQVLGHLHQFDADRGPANFKGWLFRIAFNLTVNYLNRESVRKTAERDAMETGQAGHRIEARAEQKTAQREFNQACQAAISSLPDPIKKCLMCHYFLHIGYEDIGRVYGLRQNQVAHLMSVGRRRLAKELQAFV